MARGVRFTKVEREWLLRMTDDAVMDWSHQGTKTVKVVASIHQKLVASAEAPKGTDPAPIEEALIAASRGKVIPLEGGYGMASAMCSSMKVTAEQATLVGAWLARTTYFTQPMTLIDVLKKWYQWLPKARATQPPPSLPAGLGPAGAPNADAGRGTGTASAAHPPGRPAPGFGRAASKPRSDGLP